MDDPYGVDLAVDATFDLRATPAGDLAIVAGPDNCAQALFLRLSTPHGQLSLHPDYGSNVPDQVGAKRDLAALVSTVNTDLQAVVADDVRFATANVGSVRSPATVGAPATTSLITATAELLGGEQLNIDDLSAPAGQVIDQQTADLLDLGFDPGTDSDYFAQPDEIDGLADLDTVASQTGDLPSTSTGG